ncbi:solute:sodium symporter family transporter [Fusobacterium sp. MFO224]|uniref:solute:sodium symporter family transporter n=1 Tax=Fusobacterium sp. MFO224 TaxID=3378070 RepID=UPI0038541C40
MFTVISFLFFTLLVAFLSYRICKGEDTQTNDGYFLGGRDLTGIFIAGSLMLTNLSSEQIIGQNGVSYSSSMVIIAYEIGAAVTLVLFALIFLPKYLRAGITTVPDFLEERFDHSFRQIISVVFVVSYVLTYLPTVLYSGAIVFNQLFNIQEITGLNYFATIALIVAVIAIVGAIYAVKGGLKAVAVSDTLNGVGLLIGGLLIPILALLKLGHGNIAAGVSQLFINHPEKLNTIGDRHSAVPFAVIFTGMLFNNLYYWCTNQMIIQRTFAAKNLKEGQKGVLYAGCLKLLGPFILVFPGVIAFHLIPGLSNGDLAYPALVGLVLPKPLIGFFAAVLFGAILSSFNSALNSTSTIFALNLYKPRLEAKGEDASDEKVITMGKRVGITLTILSICVAPFIMYFKGGLYGFLQEMNGFYSAPLFAVVLVGFFTKRATAKSAKAAMLVHMVFYGLYEIIKPDINFLHILGIMLPIEILVMVWMTKKNPRPEPYTFKRKEAPVEMTPWKYRYHLSTLICIIFVLYYILFSRIGLLHY